MRTKKRLLAVLLAFTLALSLLPVTALADDPEPGVEEQNPPECIEASAEDTCPLTSGTHKNGCIEACTKASDCPATGAHKAGCLKVTPPETPEPKPEECDGTINCKAAEGNHKANCIALCTKSSECPNTEGDAAVHQSGCPRAEKAAEPEKPGEFKLVSASTSIQINGRDLTLNWTLMTDPAVSNPYTSDYLRSIRIALNVGTASTREETLSNSSLSSSYTFKDILPTAEEAGSSPIKVRAEVLFNSRSGNTVTIGGKPYVTVDNPVSAAEEASYTPIAANSPASAVENPGKPLNLSYNYSTGALSWSISPTYENNVKPGTSTQINQFSNEHFILTLKNGSTIVEENIHFDTTIAASTSSEIKVTRSQNSFSAVYKPSRTLSPGTYTIELLNERSMGSGGNLTGTCTFTVADNSKATTVKGALEKLLNNGFTSSSKAADIRAAILDPVSGTTTASKLKNLTSTLQSGTSSALDLVDLVRDVEQKFLKAVGITVSRKSDSSLGTSIASVTGLGLNSASGSQITLTASGASKGYDTPSGARACQFFSLAVTGLTNNKSMDFPVQVAMKLPDSFNRTDSVYVLHYTGSSSPEKLDAYILGGNIVFTTTSFSDFALVQENANGYAVTIASAVNGAVASDKKEAAKGSTVTLTVTPNAGYSLAVMLITGKDGKSVTASRQSDTRYTFVMPDSDVTVQAAFTAAQGPSFTDVPANHTFYKEISWIAQKGIMNGTGNSQFSPSGNVNRQQLWMVLGRMAGANPANMAEARTWAINNGISDGTNPTGAVSRQQLVTMLYRYAVKQNLSVSGAADIAGYSDSGAVSGYAKDAVAWAVGNGIVSGTSDGRLNPQGSATRAHFAAFLYRFGQKTGM